MFLKCDPYRVWCSIFYSKLVNCILLRSLFVFVKGRGTCGSGERTVKIWIDFRKSPIFSLTSPLSQEREKSSRPVFTMCGEPCKFYRKLLGHVRNQHWCVCIKLVASYKTLSQININGKLTIINNHNYRWLVHFPFDVYKRYLIWGRCNLKHSRRSVIFLPVYKISSLKITPPKTLNSAQFSYPLPNIVSFLYEKKSTRVPV
jgi:hypothetical protein